MSNNEAEPMVLKERSGAILKLTLNRAEKSNSLHPGMVKQLADNLSEAEDDSELSVVIITGAGRSFCAGLDLSLMVRWTAEEKLAYLGTVTPLFMKVWKLPQPVIAAVKTRAIQVQAASPHLPSRKNSCLDQTASLSGTSYRRI